MYLLDKGKMVNSLPSRNKPPQLKQIRIGKADQWDRLLHPWQRQLEEQKRLLIHPQGMKGALMGNDCSLSQRSSILSEGPLRQSSLPQESKSDDDDLDRGFPMDSNYGGQISSRTTSSGSSSSSSGIQWVPVT